VSCHRPFLPDIPSEPPAFPTAQAPILRMQHLP
jgi:hypothetical protein